MTIDEFYAMPDDGSPTRHELVDGEAIAKEMNTLTCSRLISSLCSAFHKGLHEQKGQWAGSNVGIQPSFLANTNVRIANIGVADVPLKLDDRTMQSAVLLADVITPTSRKRVYRNFWAYLSIRSLQVIVHIHSTERLVEVYARDANGDWPDEPVSRTAGTIRCGGCNLSIDEIYRDILFDRMPTNDR
jgi:Uma2 family endonuclease